MPTTPRAAFMLAAASSLLLAPLFTGRAATPAEIHAPEIRAATALSARPALLSVGSSGPVNRHAFDVLHFSAGDPTARIACIYPRGLTYGCTHEFAGNSIAGAPRRVIVDIPDLDKGAVVTVRFYTSAGNRDSSVTIANGAQVVHEIEALLLSGGGHTTIGSDGAQAPVTQFAEVQATTVPAMTASSLGATPSCDQVYAQWISATATDPVFTSAFGTLNGAIAVSRPAARGSAVRPDNLPQWLITYPLSATRVQFIAHYEVIYRIGVCPQKIISP